MKLKKIMAALLCLSFISACSSHAENVFQDGCASAGIDSLTCGCAYSKMKAHYPSEVMDHIGERDWRAPDDFSDVMIHAAMQCRGQ